MYVYPLVSTALYMMNNNTSRYVCVYVLAIIDLYWYSFMYSVSVLNFINYICFVVGVVLHNEWRLNDWFFYYRGYKFGTLWTLCTLAKLPFTPSNTIGEEKNPRSTHTHTQTHTEKKMYSHNNNNRTENQE